MYHIASVSFINARPLTEFKSESIVKLYSAYPMDCLELLLNKQVDCSLIPSITLCHHESLKLIPSSGISSRGSVGSVLLLSNKNMDQIRSIAVDGRSSTSVILLKILCREIFKINPTFTTYHPKEEKMSPEHDATLLIGDDALWLEKTHMNVWDLGKIWFEWTNLPFVFAIWATNQEDKVKMLYPILKQAMTQGVSQISKISKEFEDWQKIEHYLTHQIQYEFNDEHYSSLEKFFDLAYQYNFISKKHNHWKSNAIVI